jgi:hypothetical protein
MSAPTSDGCSRRPLKLLAVVSVTFLVLPFFGFRSHGDTGVDAPAPKTLEEKFAFPPPLQWRVRGMEVSLVGLAWGPANSPEMIAKGRELGQRERAEFLPDRPFALALCLRATIAGPRTGADVSGLVRIKNVEGAVEYPMVLTPSGFVLPFLIPAGVNDLVFKGSDTTEQWEFFPASAAQKEFLFQLKAPAIAPFSSFRVVVKGEKFVIVNTSPGEKVTPVRFTKNFSGTIGSDASANWQLTANDTELLGTEQYTRIGKTLWLKGRVDSLGNFELEESYPKDHVTGIFRGKFSLDYRTMNGYFSKSDGSRLEPFEFREAP